MVGIRATSCIEFCSDKYYSITGGSYFSRLKSNLLYNGSGFETEKMILGENSRNVPEAY